MAKQYDETLHNETPRHRFYRYDEKYEKIFTRRFIYYILLHIETLPWANDGERRNEKKERNEKKTPEISSLQYF